MVVCKINQNHFTHIHWKLIFDVWQETSQRKISAQPTMCVLHCHTGIQNYCTCIHTTVVHALQHRLWSRRKFSELLPSEVYAATIDPLHFSISAAEIKYKLKVTKFPHTISQALGRSEVYI
jgi:hypothetical protein